MTGKGPVTIRPLAAGDVDACRALRLQALAESPTSFGASLDEEEILSGSEVLARAVPMPPGLNFGAFASGALAGMATYIPNARLKMRHKATMVAVYVRPALRGTGTGRRLVEAVIGHARSQQVILQCTVAAHNEPARALYRELGFTEYGLEQDALLVDGRYYDEALLAIDLRVDRQSD